MALILHLDFDVLRGPYTIRCQARERNKTLRLVLHPDKRQCTQPAMFMRHNTGMYRYFCTEHLIKPVLIWR